MTAVYEKRDNLEGHCRSRNVLLKNPEIAVTGGRLCRYGSDFEIAQTPINFPRLKECAEIASCTELENIVHISTCQNSQQMHSIY